MLLSSKFLAPAAAAQAGYIGMMLINSYGTYYHVNFFENSCAGRQMNLQKAEQKYTFLILLIHTSFPYSDTEYLEAS